MAVNSYFSVVSYTVYHIDHDIRRALKNIRRVLVRAVKLLPLLEYDFLLATDEAAALERDGIDRGGIFVRIYPHT